MSGEIRFGCSRQVAALAIVAALIAALAACGGDEAAPGERDRAVAAAIDAYRQASSAGVDLRTGPCIAERLPGLEDWVADIAHDPRAAVDDESSNQCRRYRDGEASHFVELTPAGELIRAE